MMMMGDDSAVLTDAETSFHHCGTRDEKSHIWEGVTWAHVVTATCKGGGGGEVILWVGSNSVLNLMLAETGSNEAIREGC